MTGRLEFLNSKEFKKRLKDLKHSELSNICVRKHYIPEEIKVIGDGVSRIIRFVISTDTVDRDKDTIAVAGWKLSHFRKNPVVLFAHDSRKPPIGRAKKVFLEDGKLKADAEFMNNDIDTSGFSDMIFRMLKGGFMKATSVGFMPEKFERVPEDEEGDRRFGINFLKQELLEFSVVPVPSNPEALIEARSKGINTGPLEEWFEEVLDDWTEHKNLLLVPRKEVEALHKAASGKGKNGVFNLSKEEEERLAAQTLVMAKAQKPGEQGYFMEPRLAGKWDILREVPGGVTAFVPEFRGVGRVEALDKLKELNSKPPEDEEFEKVDDDDPPKTVKLSTYYTCGIQEHLHQESDAAQKCITDIGQAMEAAADFKGTVREEFRWKAPHTWASSHKLSTSVADESVGPDTPEEIAACELGDLLIASAWHEDKPQVELKASDFELIHHKANGHAVVFRGVTEAMAKLLGATGGTKVPPEQRVCVYNHIARHYRDDFKMEPPEFRFVEAQVLADGNDWFCFDYEAGTLRFIDLYNPGTLTDPAFATVPGLSYIDEEGQPKDIDLGNRDDVGEEKQEDSFIVQTIIFPKSKWGSLDAAKVWAKDHGFKTSKIDETSTSYRFKQRDLGDFERLRTICINPGDEPASSDKWEVRAVGGPVKSVSAASSTKRFKLVSDGTLEGTKLVDNETGDVVGDVVRVEWSIGKDQPVRAVVELSATEADIQFPNVYLTGSESDSDEDVIYEDMDPEDKILDLTDEDKGPPSDDPPADEDEDDSIDLTEAEISTLIAEVAPQVISGVVDKAVKKIRGKAD